MQLFKRIKSNIEILLSLYFLVEKTKNIYKITQIKQKRIKQFSFLKFLRFEIKKIYWKKELWTNHSIILSWVLYKISIQSRIIIKVDFFKCWFKIILFKLKKGGILWPNKQWFLATHKQY